MKAKEIKTKLKPENGIEEAIVAHQDFIEGCNYGKPRSGHPEGKVVYHIVEVLENIDEFFGDDPDRSDLRLIALVHDTFKHKVDRNKPKVGENHHGTIARIEVHSEDMDKVMDNSLRLKIVEKLKSLGFKFVVLDLDGFRSGSLNELLSEEDRAFKSD